MGEVLLACLPLAVGLLLIYISAGKSGRRHHILKTGGIYTTALGLLLLFAVLFVDQSPK